MRRVLGVIVACASLVAGPAQAGPETGTWRVVVRQVGIAGVLEGECVAHRLPDADPYHDSHALAFVAATTYASPALVAVCRVVDAPLGGSTFGSVAGTTAVAAAAGAGVVPVPVGVPRTFLCLDLSAGGQTKTECAPAAELGGALTGR